MNLIWRPLLRSQNIAVFFRVLVLVTTVIWLPRASAADLDSIQRFIDNGKQVQALKQLDLILAEHPDDLRAEFLKGTALAQVGRIEDAIIVFKRLIRVLPGTPEAYNNLAVLYAAKGALGKSRQTLEQAMATHEGYATVYKNLGSVYADMARDSYAKALQLKGKHAAPRLQMLTDIRTTSETSAATITMASMATPKAMAVELDLPKPVDSAPKVVTSQPLRPVVTSSAVVTAKAVDTVSIKRRNNIPADVIATLQSWARAWEGKKVDQYLSYYARDFVPAGNMSRKHWEKLRRKRLLRPRDLKITLNTIHVSVLAEDKVLVKLQQDYTARHYKDNGRKEFTLARRDGRWQILSEVSVK